MIRGIDGYMNEATFDPRTPKGQGMVGYRISDFDVVFYGDTAVASFVLEVDAIRGTQKVSQKLTILDVFHKEPQRWVQVASNTSYHSDEFERRGSELRPIGDDEKREVLAAREAVWRAWFAGDTKQLTSLLPPELITIEPSSSHVRKPQVEPGRIARVCRRRREADTSRLSDDGNAGVRRDGDCVHDLRDGSPRGRQDAHGAWRGDRGIRPPERPLGQHRLAVGPVYALARFR